MSTCMVYDTTGAATGIDEAASDETGLALRRLEAGRARR